MRRHHAVIGAAFFTFFTSAGCKSVKGSCDKRANGTFECVEVTAATIAESSKGDCLNHESSLERGKWAEKTACDRNGAIGGCESNLSRTWYYPGGRVSKIEHVAQLCSGSSKLLDASGNERKGVTPSILPVSGPGSAPDPALEAMISAQRAPLETIVGAIEKLRAAGPVSGTVKLTGGKHVLASDVVAAVWEDDITTMISAGAPWRKDVPLDRSDDLRYCASAVRLKNRLGKSDAELQRVLKWCAGLTTIAVVKASKLLAPAPGVGTDFKSGLVEGAAYIYELPSGKLAGAYAFQASSSDKVKVNMLDEADFAHKLSADFAANIGKALTAGLAKADPGATYSFTVKQNRQ